MNWEAWLVWGFAATVILSTTTSGFHAAGWTRIDLSFLLGTMATPDRDRARLAGTAAHLVIGWVLSLVYVAAFHTSGIFSAWFGAAIGLVHGAFVLLVGLPLMPAFHPRMASDHHGPEAGRLLEPPGFAALHYGITTPVSLLIAHVLFGAVLGAFYSPVG